MRLATSSPSSMANRANEFNYPINLNVKSFNRFTAQPVFSVTNTYEHSRSVFFSRSFYCCLLLTQWVNTLKCAAINNFQNKHNGLATAVLRVRRHTSFAWKSFFFSNSRNKKKTLKAFQNDLFYTSILCLLKNWFRRCLVPAIKTVTHATNDQKFPISFDCLSSGLRVFFYASAGWANTEMIGK